MSDAGSEKSEKDSPKNSISDFGSTLSNEASNIWQRVRQIGGRIHLPNSHHADADGAALLGPTDPEKQINVTVMVKSKASEKEIDDTLNKISSGKMKPLSETEFNAKFGADQEAMQRVLKFAQDHHLTAREINDSSGRVLLSGKSKDFSTAFKVDLKDYDDSNGAGPFHAHNKDVSVPRGVGKDIEGVFGLDNRKLAEPHIVFPPKPDPFQPHGLFTGYMPDQVAKAYNFPQESMGAGQNVAIIELGGGLDFKDNAEYYKSHNYKLPELRVVTVAGAENKTGSQADGEVALDSQVIGVLAPDAKQTLVFAPNTDQGFVDAIDRAAFPQKGELENSAISVSWGAPESSWTAEARHSMDLAFKKAALKGISIFCASGDSGSKDNSKDGKHTTDFPSTDQWVTGTGGTKLLLDNNGHRKAEVAWNDGRLIGLGKLVAGGGGISATEAVPDYQAGTKLPPNANGTNQPGRGVPDISGNASMLEGYQIRFGGHEMPVGGTSAVAPLYAALTMRVNGALGHNIGFINPFIYKNPEVFHDVTSGNNQGYSAGPGWDAVTGLGVIDGQKFLDALKKASK